MSLGTFRSSKLDSTVRGIRQQSC